MLRRPSLAPLATLLLALSPLGAFASSGTPSPSRTPEDPDLAAARKAVEARDWPQAIRHLELARGREPRNADVHNLMGFAERKQGHLEAAFAHYDEALRLDPKHRGAHEYAGEAFLLAGNLAKAEEHLAALDKLCTFSCEEYRDLKKSIADYKRKQPAPAR